MSTLIKYKSRIKPVIQNIESNIVNPIQKKVRKKAKKIIKDVKKIIGGSVSTGGAVSTGGIVSIPNPRHHYDLIHMLHHMTDSDFRIMQSLAGGSLNIKDHLTHIFHRHFGSDLFKHPVKLSKIATMDLVHSLNPHHLAKMLQGELHEIVRNKFKLTGGGLFDSVRHFARKTSRLLSSGFSAFQRIGSRINNGLKIGIAVSDFYKKDIQNIFGDDIHNILSRATDIAKTSQVLLDTSLDRTQGLDVLSNLVGALLQDEQKLEIDRRNLPVRNLPVRNVEDEIEPVD